MQNLQADSISCARCSRCQWWNYFHHAGVVIGASATSNILDLLFIRWPLSLLVLFLYYGGEYVSVSTQERHGRSHVAETLLLDEDIRIWNNHSNNSTYKMVRWNVPPTLDQQGLLKNHSKPWLKYAIGTKKSLPIAACCLPPLLGSLPPLSCLSSDPISRIPATVLIV